MWQLKVWFITAESPDPNRNVFMFPREKWEKGCNASYSHYDGACFGSAEEALDFCYAYSNNHMKLTPLEMYFKSEVLH